MRRAWVLVMLLAGCADWDDLAAKARCHANPGACVAGSSVWPDSPTVHCSDGKVEISCPTEGQTGYGQDGNYRIAVPTYEAIGRVIHDTVTGLDWEDRSTNSGLTWSAAGVRCGALQLEGRTWRLPTRLELASLLDFGGGRPFPDLHRGPHWSSSPAPTSSAWQADFLDFKPQTRGVDADAFVVCVSGAPLAGAFATEGDVLHDSLTGLTWQRVADSQYWTWLEALGFCEGLALAGRTDWRLPSAKELLTLGQDDETAVTGLEGRAGEKYWTSSPGASATNINVVLFPSGQFGSDDSAFPAPARCVRGPD